MTYLKWLPSNNDLIIECSEDLTLRLWDIRAKPFKPPIEFKVGTNFATTCDILSQDGQDNYLVTGHRGFNNEGADVKLWDLRSFGAENLVFNYTKHKFNPEAVRFVSSDLIVTASKDQSMHLIDLTGDQVDVMNHSESLISLACVEGSSSKKNKGDKYLVAADVKAGVSLYHFDHKKRQIRSYNE